MEDQLNFLSATLFGFLVVSVLFNILYFLDKRGDGFFSFWSDTPIGFLPASGVGAYTHEFPLGDPPEYAHRDAHTESSTGEQAFSQSGVKQGIVGQVNPELSPFDNENNIPNRDGESAQVNYLDKVKRLSSGTVQIFIEPNAQPYLVISPAPSDADDTAGRANQSRRPSCQYRPIHASASLSKEREACPCNLLL